MRGRGLFVFVAVIVAGALAAPAGAEPTRVDRIPGDVIEGPRLAGDSVFYGEVGRRRIALRLASSVPPRRKLAELSPPPSPPDEEEGSPGDYVEYSSAIEASSEWLAFKQVVSSGNARYQQGTSSLSLFGGTLTGDFGQTETCSNNNYYGPAAAALDVDGARSASSNCDGSVVIRDHSGASPNTTVSAGNMLAIGDLDLAGRYLAYNAYPISPTGTSQATTVVHDWVANTKAYEVPRVASFDLQDDGTLAVSTGQIDDLDCSDGKLAWYSIAQPTEHVLPVKPCTSEVRIVGGRIAVVAAGSNETERMLALVGLDGARTDVARLGSGLRRGGLDFDGERVAYALGNCLGGADLFTAPANAPVLRDEPIACPVGGLPKKGSLGPKDTAAHVNVNCPRGCRGRLTLTAQVNGKTKQIGTRVVSIHPEDLCLAKIHRVTIKSSVRSLLRSRGSLLARVTVATSDRNGAPRVATRGFRLRAASRNRGNPTGDCWI
ncbi:MAG TPA: hypothetical protein VHF45_11300 [Thermoleophilaceae bacterium]|nr:hypothetical protein [Thermoleophilaceae bacterium]